jgi:hypothetical protein
MKHLSSVVLFLGISILLPSLGFAQSAYGIKIPVRGASDQPVGVVEAPVVDAATGLDLVKAENLSDAAAGAAKQAADPAPTQGQSKFKKIEGTSIFEDDYGNAGLMVVGSAMYDTNYPNPDAVRMARRGAYVRAHAQAMAMLTDKVYGADVDQQLAIISKVTTTTTDQSTLEVEDNKTNEEILSASSGLIRGAQIWKCEDQGGTVRIWLFMTNDSATGNRHLNSRMRNVSVSQYQQAVDSVMDEILNGFLPPMGGKVVVCPENGQATFVGFGTSIITNTRRGASAAEEKAKMRAKAGFIALINGAEVDYNSSLTGVEAQTAVDFQNFGQALPPAEGDEQLVEGVTAAFSNTEAIQGAIKQSSSGKLPPGAQDVGFVDEENGWHTHVYIWTVGADKLMEGLRGDATFQGDRATRKFDEKKPGPSGQGKDPRQRGGSFGLVVPTGGTDAVRRS